MHIVEKQLYKITRRYGKSEFIEAESIDAIAKYVGESDRAGQYSIRINDQFRVCFYWNDGNVIIEDICDYH